MNLRSNLCGLLAAGASVLALGGCQSSVRQLSFDSPEDAVAALRYAAATGDRAYSRSLFGPEADELSSGDAEVDQYERSLFSAAIHRRHELRANADGTYDVLVGEDAVPFPVPIVEYGGRWLFDSPAGVERMTDIRVGYHELRTIEALRAVRIAQDEYRSMDRDGDGVFEYAQQFRSDPGTRDGLYWPTSPEEPNSPLGAYYVEGETPVSRTLGYNGYFYTVLTGQAAGAPGGARSYLDQRGNLAGGYAVLAYPAVYGETAVMTFQMGSDGVIYEADLGPDETATAGRDIGVFDPSGWSVVRE